MRRAALIGGALLGALALRVIPWLANLPLHHDEALYGTWARAIADGSDPFLLAAWVDKPPLVLYLLALAVRTTGVSELSLRFPGLLAGLLVIPVTHAIARRLYGGPASWAAAGLMALSPFAILFAPTAFTDGWLALFAAAAVWAAVTRRPVWAGVLLGFAAASKQQGVLFAPLVLLLIVRFAPRNARRPAVTTLRATVMALLGFAAVFGPVTWWDSLRWHNRPSYWDQSLQTYGGIVLLPAAEWPGRAVLWAEQAGRLYGLPLLSALVLAAAFATFAGALSRQTGLHPSTMLPSVAPLRMLEPGHSGDHAGSGSVADQSTFSWLTGGFVAAYFVVHIIVSFQPWDRYLLPVLPLICVLAGRGVVGALAALRARAGTAVARAAAGAAAIALLWSAGLGVTARLPVGSDVGAYRGVAQAARFLASQPAGATVYYDRVGWHLGFYLYDASVTRSWYDSPEKLASEASRTFRDDADAVQWLLLPAWEAPDLQQLAGALRRAGFDTREAAAVRDPDGTVDLTLYRIEPVVTAVRGDAASEEPSW